MPRADVTRNNAILTRARRGRSAAEIAAALDLTFGTVVGVLSRAARHKAQRREARRTPAVLLEDIVRRHPHLQDERLARALALIDEMQRGHA